MTRSKIATLAKMKKIAAILETTIESVEMMNTLAKTNAASPRIGTAMDIPTAKEAKMKWTATSSATLVSSRVLQKSFHQGNDDKTTALVKNTSAMVSKIACLKVKTKQTAPQFTLVHRTPNVSSFVPRHMRALKNAPAKWDLCWQATEFLAKTLMNVSS